MLNVTRNLLILAVGVGAAFPTLASAQSKNATGAVFVMTNDANKNEVIAFERAANGTLGDSVSYDTHGRGSGGITDPLESQGSLTLSQDRSLLFAVNAGSGDVTVFNVHQSGALNFLSNTPSGGAQPSAVAEFNGLVYVLNSGGAGSLVGFNLNNGGQLRQIKNSTAFLTGTTTGGASLAFSPDGQFLVVTERIANNIDVFHVQPDGTLSPIVVNPNPAPGTFSVAFAPKAQPSSPKPARPASATAPPPPPTKSTPTAPSPRSPRASQPSRPETAGTQSRLMEPRSTSPTLAATTSLASTSPKTAPSLPSLEPSSATIPRAATTWT